MQGSRAHGCQRGLSAAPCPPVAGPQALQAHGAVIWALAFAPVLGMAAEAMVGTAVHGSVSGAERALAHPFSL